MYEPESAIAHATKSLKVAVSWLTGHQVARSNSPKVAKRIQLAGELTRMALRILKAETATLDQLSLIVPAEAARIAGCHKTTVLRALKSERLQGLTVESEGSVERGQRAVNVLLRMDVEEVLGTKGLTGE